MTEKEELEYEMRPEYDFSKGRPNPYSKRAKEARNLVFMEDDLLAIFPDKEAVNRALRLVVKERLQPTKPELDVHAKAS